jgi:hypothetical protein
MSSSLFSKRELAHAQLGRIENILDNLGQVFFAVRASVFRCHGTYADSARN